MNKILNDAGVWVYAVGQDGSIARIKEQYPTALKRCESLFFQGSYSHLGVQFAYVDAMNELIELHGNVIAHDILRASIFQEYFESSGQ